MPRDWTTSRFKKTIAITTEQYEFVRTTKGRKTLAGRLEQIINAYQKDYPDEETM